MLESAEPPSCCDFLTIRDENAPIRAVSCHFGSVKDSSSQLLHVRKCFASRDLEHRSREARNRR
jgi:hypothetical protein